MLSMFENLTKAAVSAVMVPVGVVADVVSLPASSLDPYRKPFGYTERLLENARDCFNEATKPAKEL